MTARSLYSEAATDSWLARTSVLVKEHPLDLDELVQVVLGCWSSIFDSTIAGFRIGVDIEPKPQIMGFLLHELIPLELSRRYPSLWSGESSASDKDLVYIPDPGQSVEIKTSSHKSQIFGNRSYAQKGDAAKKSKSGYYLAVNFEPFGRVARMPEITRIRFGWLDSDDWVGQKAATGQQARVIPEAERRKLVLLYERAKS